MEAGRADLQHQPGGVGIDGAGTAERTGRAARCVGDAAIALDPAAERRCVGQRAAGQDDIADACRTAVDDEFRIRQNDGEPGAGALVQRQRADRDIQFAGHGHAIQRAALRNQALRGRDQRAAGDHAGQIDLSRLHVESAGDGERAGDRQGSAGGVQRQAADAGGLPGGDDRRGLRQEDGGVRAGVRHETRRNGRAGNLHHIRAVGIGGGRPGSVNVTWIVAAPKLPGGADSGDIRSVGRIRIPEPSDRRTRRRVAYHEHPILTVDRVRNLRTAHRQRRQLSGGGTAAADLGIGRQCRIGDRGQKRAGREIVARSAHGVVGQQINLERAGVGIRRQRQPYGRKVRLRRGELQPHHRGAGAGCGAVAFSGKRRDAGEVVEVDRRGRPGRCRRRRTPVGRRVPVPAGRALPGLGGGGGSSRCQRDPGLPGPAVVWRRAAEGTDREGVPRVVAGYGAGPQDVIGPVQQRQHASVPGGADRVAQAGQVERVARLEARDRGLE